MAIAADSNVVVIDQSSEYRNKRGTVIAALSGSAFTVRFDGHSCGKPIRMLGSQLAETGLTSPLNYSHCA